MKPRLILLVLSVLSLVACGDGQADSKNQQAVDALIKKIKENLVCVKGGSFQMGDFGQIDPKSDKLPYSVNQDDKYLHRVTLDDFYIQDRQVTYSDFNVYAKSINEPAIEYNEQESQRNASDLPAGVDWYKANKYCQWLSKQTGKDYSLPTEAQWEYAARSRGRMMPYATDDGKLEPGKNYPTRSERMEVTPQSDAYSPFPVAEKYPPNPLGLYQMGLNGYEWVSDWYDKGYYEKSPEHNPKGPDSGTLKVRRGGATGESSLGLVTVIRNPYSPDLSLKVPEGADKDLDIFKKRKQSAKINTFRCVIAGSSTN
ncbi:MAG: sulfatase modifying factor 1 [Salinicola sp.]|nr:sulfatase modifying factor 1 [Salinicola sp.]|tara:strand:+ start:965 stop:1903 length:939 start_codon:yes stop_codon:yes gene_type:complete